MPKSAKERMQEYRQRLHQDPERLEVIQAKDRERWHTGKRKRPINEQPESQQKVLRKRWKKSSKEYRDRKMALKPVLTNTPPHSPSADEDAENPAENPATPPTGNQASENKKTGRKRLRKDRAKVYRDNAKLHVQVESLTRTSDKYRKRAERAEAHVEHTAGHTPRRATKKLLLCDHSKVKKTLLFHHVLMSELNSSMTEKTRGSEREKQIVSKVFGGKVLKKYKLLNFAKKNYFAVSRKRIDNNLQKNGRIGKYERKRQSNVVPDETKAAVMDFFERDDNSRISTTIKDTKTQKGDKRTKRFLQDTTRNLHSKFKAENQDARLSYSQFCKHKPFWVVVPKVSDRDTCLCKKHDNLQLQADRLHELRLLQSKRVEDNIPYVVCDPKEHSCMFGECGCPNRTLTFSDMVPDEQNVWWWEWKTVKETYTNKQNVEKSVQKTVRQKVDGTVGQLKTSFRSELKDTLCPHVFNIRHQFQWYRKLKQDVSDVEAVLHIDFSENWQCKYAQQIQSAHFGDSNKQATLHTGVCYTKTGTSSFCSISDSRRHDPAAIWAHLTPVLERLRNDGIEILHFFSDGPTTQYRNRTNLYLFSTILYQQGFEGGTWNFFEAGHGKGAADGIGGVVKRRADDIVARGKDVTDPETLYHTLHALEGVVKLYYIPDSAIEDMEQNIPIHVNPVTGIMKVHQVCTQSQQQIMTKSLSCFCAWPTQCTCYMMKTFMLRERTELAKETTIEQADVARSNEDTTHPLISEPLPAPGSSTTAIQKDQDLVNKWCVMEYDSKSYVGKILAQDDESVEIQELRSVGNNKFVESGRDEQTLWYSYDKLIAIIPAPIHKSKRQLSMDTAIWNTYFT